MADHLDLGVKGEKLAQNHLRAQQYEVLEINWRFQKAEIDIIAYDGEVLAFVEVKTRTTDKWGKPEESISPKKQALIADAASQYMELIKHEWEVRFDVISIIIPKYGPHRLHHHKDAFFPGW
ncbi:MAG: YraN family protein [Saprospiraceae bacterium]|nr:YraN family protein [Saprospiraceae bacterium]